MFIDGAQVADKAVDGILQRIDALAAKIGTTAQHIWDVYVAQARVEAIRDTVFVVLFLIVSSLLAYLSYRLFRYGIKRDGYDDWPYITGGFAGFFSLAILVASLVIFYGAIGEWLNPQYWAFQQLTKDLKNLF
jgi:hypothetical protein